MKHNKSMDFFVKFLKIKTLVHKRVKFPYWRSFGDSSVGIERRHGI